MAGFDDVIHQPMRLKIMATLNALPAGEQLDFVRLRAILAATEGNLGAHLATLEKAGFISVDKTPAGKKPRTSVALTRPGKRAFDGHVEALKDLLQGGAPPAPAAI